jgi:hypothetical protein
VGSCWILADPELALPVAPPPGSQLQGGVLATFAVEGEQFRVWVTNPQTIAQIMALQAGESTASIPNGRILRGPGPGAHNLPWNWHLDPSDIEMAEMTTEVCDGWPSYVNAHLDEFVDNVGRFCPWSAQLVEVIELRDVAESCPSPSEGTQLLVNEGQGYCLLYPDEYAVYYPNQNEVSLVIGSLMNHTEPRASITVEGAAGRTVAQAADELMAEFGGGAGFDIERETTTVGGEDAVVLDNMPGQDLHRRVVVIHGDLLYWLFFAPVGADYGEVGTRTEALYETIVDSLHFLPGPIAATSDD